MFTIYFNISAVFFRISWTDICNGNIFQCKGKNIINITLDIVYREKNYLVWLMHCMT